MMDERLEKLLFDPNGPLGMTEGFYQNAVAEIGGFVLAALVFSILLPIMIDWRQARKWRPARQNFGQELLLLHVAFGEAVLRYVRTPTGPSRLRAADVVDNAYRAFPTLTGLYGYALTAEISREVNDYMRIMRAVRDWAYEAAHPEDVGFAAVERQVKQTRDMFERVNAEFKDVLRELGVKGFEDVRWRDDVIAELAAAFDATHGKR
jgi:hypothetical protein